MKVLLVYPSHPDTFWSFRHVVRLVGKRSAFPPLGDAFWRLFWGTLVASPAKFHAAMELPIIGRHFRTVAARL